MQPPDFHAALMAYCYRTRASVTSYGRTEAHNGLVGGVQTSYHLLWLAADVVYDAPLELSIRYRTAAQLGLRLIAEHDHDHLQPMTPRQVASVPARMDPDGMPASSGLVGRSPGSPLTMPWYADEELQRRIEAWRQRLYERACQLPDEYERERDERQGVGPERTVEISSSLASVTVNVHRPSLGILTPPDDASDWMKKAPKRPELHDSARKHE